jgi:hypothetical protein
MIMGYFFARDLVTLFDGKKIYSLVIKWVSFAHSRHATAFAR